ncbi:ABC transporter permease [Cumulibacter soli]|uniref:ABC transporter permease n=1 Tax=Cumulibacter soli TaxID=2546344 RepID=UPI001067CC25|nr:ABC transporter permease [Cumulibacter soli]
MTTSTVTPVRPARLGMRGLPTLIASEARLFTRDFGNLFFVLLFPTVLLVGMGYAIPDMREPLTDAGALNGLRVVDLFLPVMFCVAAATAGLAALPAYLASYRETGVLRRLSTTPMRPAGVLLAQVVIHFGGVIVGSLLALIAGVLVFDSPMPDAPLLSLLVFVLAVASMFGFGLLIGGLANKATTAQGIGMLLYFPMLFTAGLWTPGPAMPETLQTISTYTPLGAASQAMSDAWYGGDFPALQLVVVTAWAVVLFLAAARFFRWK